MTHTTSRIRTGCACAILVFLIVVIGLGNYATDQSLPRLVLAGLGVVIVSSVGVWNIWNAGRVPREENDDEVQG